MNYELQKITLENEVVYNILFESKLLGHVILSDEQMTLVQAGELPIAPIAESFGFSGEANLVEGENSSKVMLNSTPEFKPLYEYKIVNLPDSALTE